jgi:hypothetical protein
VCAGRPVLREQVEALLRPHQEGDTFLDVPAVGQVAAAESLLSFLRPLAEVLKCVSEATPASLKEINLKVPEWLDEVICRLHFLAALALLLRPWQCSAPSDDTVTKRAGSANHCPRTPASCTANETVYMLRMTNPSKQ